MIKWQINCYYYLKLIELHIYILPRDVWITKQKLAYNETIQEAISYGFIRVRQDLILNELRGEIKSQCVNEDIPPDYVFLRSVGRALTRVKPHQEFELKAKYFLPPQVRTSLIYKTTKTFKWQKSRFKINILRISEKLTVKSNLVLDET